MRWMRWFALPLVSLLVLSLCAAAAVLPDPTVRVTERSPLHLLHMPPNWEGSTEAPEDGLRRCLAMYASRNVESYEMTLDSDYRFFPGNAESRTRFPAGMSREDEVESYRHLVHGFTDALGVRRPAASDIRISLDHLDFIGESPGDQDSLAVLIAREVILALRFEDRSTIETAPADHTFLMARDGRAAAERTVCPHRLWRIRRWVEGPVDAVALRATLAPAAAVAKPGALRDSAAAASGEPDVPVALELAFVRMPAVLRGESAVTLSLPDAAPARLEAFDVAGRRMDDVRLDGLGRGIHRVGLGALAVPGVYWLRLTQLDRRVHRRIVTIR